MRPRALDLFCGAGGASMGLFRAGFDVTGVDIHRQRDYPFNFIHKDALEMGQELPEYDFIWASPPCQAYTGMQRINTRAPRRDHPRLIEPVRQMLRDWKMPHCIENVPGAPLENPIVLCGSMFDLGVWRHRLFECNFWMLRPECRHDKYPKPIAVYGDHPQQPGDKTYRVNRARNLSEGQQAMGIDWMGWKPLTQAIPPDFAEFIGRAALWHIRQKAA